MFKAETTATTKINVNHTQTNKQTNELTKQANQKKSTKETVKEESKHFEKTRCYFLFMSEFLLFYSRLL